MGTDREFREEETARSAEARKSSVLPNSGPTPTSAADRSRDTYARTSELELPSVINVRMDSQGRAYKVSAHESTHDDA